MSFFLNGILLTCISALAVKQVGLALTSGSLFDPLRKTISRKMNEDVLGFELMNELFTCRLCMCMQVALWLVMIPTIIVGYVTHVVPAVLGTDMGTLLETSILLIGSFVYATAVSGVAQALWTYLEFPAKRYHDVARKLMAAEEKIEDLEYELESRQTPKGEAA